MSRRFVLARSAVAVAVLAGLACKEPAPPPPVLLDDEPASPAERCPYRYWDCHISPFGDFRFDRGNWAAYVFLHRDDLGLHKAWLRRSCLVLRDRQALERFAREVEFWAPSGADVATISSVFLLTLDGQPVYETRIEIDPDGSDGLQSGAFGWLQVTQPGALLEFVQKFEPIVDPTIDLPEVPWLSECVENDRRLEWHRAR